MMSFKKNYFSLFLIIFGFDLSAHPMTMSEIAKTINLPLTHKGGENVQVVIVEGNAPKDFTNMSGQKVPVSDEIKAVQDNVQLKPLDVEVNQVLLSDKSNFPLNLEQSMALCVAGGDAEWMADTAKTLKLLIGNCESSHAQHIRYSSEENKMFVFDVVYKAEGVQPLNVLAQSPDQQQLITLPNGSANMVVNLVGNNQDLFDPNDSLKDTIRKNVDLHSWMRVERQKAIEHAEESKEHCQDVSDIFHSFAPKANFSIYSPTELKKIATTDARIINLSSSVLRDSFCVFCAEIQEAFSGTNKLVVVALDNENRAIADLEAISEMAKSRSLSVIFVSQHEASADGREVSEFLPKENDAEFRLHFMTAPGLNIQLPRDNCVKSGSSFSTPIVSAAAAIVLSHYPDLTAAELKRILVESGTKNLDNPHDPNYRNTVNVTAALEMAAGLRK